MKVMTTIAAIALALPAIAQADTVLFYTGGEGGGYDAAAVDIAQRLEQRGVEAEIVNRNGSDDITLQACRAEGPSMWIAQKDALWVREIQDGCQLVDLALYGSEYAMIFFPPGSSDNELSDLDAADTVLVDRVGSGSELTWRTMVGIEAEHGRGDEWSLAGTETSSPQRATSMASRGTIQAVFLVRTLQSGDVAALISQGWELGEMYDRDINDLEWNGSPLYEAERVDIVLEGDRRGRDWAYVVPSFIGTTPAVERREADLFDAMLSAVN